MLSNSLSRRRLAAFLERVVFQAGDASFLTEPFDEFGLVRVPIDAGNQHDALLASGTIPLVCAPVRDIGGAPQGRYWDGALVDYHLLLPYPRLVAARSAAGRGSIVLYPHFDSRVIPGWLDKHFPWRGRRANIPGSKRAADRAVRFADRAAAQPQAAGSA